MTFLVDRRPLVLLEELAGARPSECGIRYVYFVREVGVRCGLPRGRKVRPLAGILVKSVVDINHKVRGYDLRQAGQDRDHRNGLHWVR